MRLDATDRILFDKLRKTYIDKRLDMQTIKVWMELSFFYLVILGIHFWIFSKILNKAKIIEISIGDIGTIYIIIMLGVLVNTGLLRSMKLSLWVWFLSIRNPTINSKMYFHIINANKSNLYTRIHNDTIRYFANAIIIRNQCLEYFKHPPILDINAKVDELKYIELVFTKLNNFYPGLSAEDKEIFNKIKAYTFKFRLKSLLKNFIFQIYTLLVLILSVVVLYFIDFDLSPDEMDFTNVYYHKFTYLLFLTSLMFYLFYVYDYLRISKTNTINWVMFNIIRDEGDNKILDARIIENIYLKYNFNNIIAFNLMNYILKPMMVTKFRKLPNGMENYYSL